MAKATKQTKVQIAIVIFNVDILPIFSDNLENNKEPATATNCITKIEVIIPPISIPNSLSAKGVAITNTVCKPIE